MRAPSRGKTFAFIIILPIAFVGNLSPSWADSRPLLQRVFVSEGRERLRLVAHFDRAVPPHRIQPLHGDAGLSVFLPGVRGGKPQRKFEVNQGGYGQVEARENKKGLWLTVRTEKPSMAVGRTDVSINGSTLTLTLPKILPRPKAAAGRISASKPGARAGKPVGKTKGATAEDILERIISSTAPAPAVASAPAPAAPRALDAGRPLTGFGRRAKKRMASRTRKGDRRRPASGGKLRLPSESFNPAAMFGKMILALGAILGLILGGLYLIKKFAPSAASRLGAGGKLVRTLHKTYLAPKKTLALVDVAGEVLVLGISGQNISMLTKLESEASLERVRTGGEVPFLHHLTKFMEEEKSGTNGEKTDSPEEGKDEELAGKIASALQAYGGASPSGQKDRRRARAAGPGWKNSGGVPPGLIAGGGERPAGEVSAPSADRAVARLRERIGRIQQKSPEMAKA